MTEVEEQEEYEVRIGAFNGPMDLLVYLVQKKEVPLEQISRRRVISCTWRAA